MSNKLKEVGLINPEIFRAYDIRGIYPSEFDEQAAYAIARAFVVQQACSKVVLGRDTRLSSEKIAKAVRLGIKDQGACVIDAGKVSTPLFYFAVNSLNRQGLKSSGIMITASHDPKDYNGIKMVNENCMPLKWKGELEKIKELGLKQAFPMPKKRGCIKKRAMDNEYIKFICSHIKTPLRGERIVLDASSGVGAPVYKKILKRLGIKAKTVNTVPDGNFPVHSPNPLDPNSRKEAEEMIKKNSRSADNPFDEYSFGVITDGDGDRCIFIDEKGNYVMPDNIIAAFTFFLTKHNRNAAIAYPCNASRIVADIIRKNNAKGFISKVGRSNLRITAKENDVLFAGEVSGHFFFRELDYFDDGTFAALKLLELLKNERVKLSDLNEEFSKGYSRTGELNFKVKDSAAAMKAIGKSKSLKGGKRSFIDGISIEYSNVWLNARPSNTEPLVRVVIEGKSREEVESLRKKVVKIFGLEK
ncbi:MAG: phosphomannomutase/phosphoglucomutase [Candidatus Woesearchaeota archaeon]